MEPETQRKIEETVIDILKKADMEEITEFKVRVMASERLKLDLSDKDRKVFVRTVLESFLLSTATEETIEAADTNRKVNDDGDRVICKLSNKRRVVIQDSKGKSFVAIREFYQKDGKQLPSARGISLTTEQWSAFKRSVPAIEEAVMKMQSKLRSELDGEQNEDVSKSLTASTHEFVPIETNRFDGKNYHSWAAQMEFFLNQLKVAYVLTDPGPSVTLSPEVNTEVIARAKAAEQKWMNDNYICRHNILSCLSDRLYYQYSKKTKSAKELWEELKSVYFYEEFGTKRSKVKKYIEFKMVDERSITEQVKELNSIADSVLAAGMLIDENFHVSTIISKLPPSWKDFCIKLMPEEYMPFRMLMDHLRVEEESRNQNKQGGPSNFVDLHLTKNHGPRTTEMKKPGMSWKRREAEMDNKGVVLVCYNCGKQGHVSKHCRSKKVDEDINGKQDGDNLTTPTPAVMEVKMVESIAE